MSLPLLDEIAPDANHAPASRPPPGEQPTTKDPFDTDRGGLWDYISPSRLNLWLRCPLAFKLRYVDGVTTPPTQSLFLGQRVHAGLEFFYRHQQLGINTTVGDVCEHVTATWSKAAEETLIAFDDADQEADLQQQAASLLAAYLNQRPADEPRPLAVETAFEAPLLDHNTGETLPLPLVGILDLVLPGPDGPVIVDFKTAARASAPIEQLHEVQLTAYAHLYRQLTGQAESGLEIRSLIKTKTPQVQTQRFPRRTAGHFARFAALVRAYLADLEANRFIYRPSQACSYCDHRETHCPTWSG